jgi:hypothetical protein
MGEPNRNEALIVTPARAFFVKNAFIKIGIAAEF